MEDTKDKFSTSACQNKLCIFNTFIEVYSSLWIKGRSAQERSPSAAMRWNWQCWNQSLQHQLSAYFLMWEYLIFWVHGINKGNDWPWVNLKYFVPGLSWRKDKSAQNLKRDTVEDLWGIFCQIQHFYSQISHHSHQQSALPVNNRSPHCQGCHHRQSTKECCGGFGMVRTLSGRRRPDIAVLFPLHYTVHCIAHTAVVRSQYNTQESVLQWRVYCRKQVVPLVDCW